METKEYRRLAEVEDTYWWHVGRLEIVRRELARQPRPAHSAILNVGCGTGGTVPMLRQFGTVDNVDISAEAVAFSRARGIDRVQQADATSLPFPDGTFDLIVALDVLEHIRDDGAALAEWRRVLKADGRLIVTVPAYQWLWSSHDVALHHHRRYSRPAMREAARRSALSIERLSHAIVFSLPLVVGFRLLNSILRRPGGDANYVQLPTVANRLFTMLLVAEGALHRWVRFPAGTSLLAVLSQDSANR